MDYKRKRQEHLQSWRETWDGLIQSQDKGNQGIRDSAYLYNLCIKVPNGIEAPKAEWEKLIGSLEDYANKATENLVNKYRKEPKA